MRLIKILRDFNTNYEGNDSSFRKGQIVLATAYTPIDNVPWSAAVVVHKGKVVRMYHYAYEVLELS